MFRILIALFLLSLPAQAEETIVADLSQDNISITATFDGTGILIFGAVKRETPPPDVGPLHVVVEVSGPSLPVMVRRKERSFGIWVNKDFVEVDEAPSFYAIASTAPLAEVLSDIEDLRFKVSVSRLIRSVGAPSTVSDPDSFPEAVIRIRQKEGLYSQSNGHVELLDETLFRTQIALPSNLVEGDYKTRIFLTRDQKVVDVFETAIAVRKVGLERWIFNLAHERPLIYGLLSLTIAILAGWLASTVFRLLRLN